MKLPIINKKTIAVVMAFVLICGFAVTGNAFVEQKNRRSATVETENKKLSKKVDKLEKQIEDKDAELSDAKKKNSDLQAQCEHQQATIDQQAAQIASLQASLNAAQQRAKQQSNRSGNVAAPFNPSGNRICYLTFDDGPSATTPRLLSVLQSVGVKATFFVVNTAYLDDYCDDIYNAGHEIGLHCNNHTFASVYASPAAYYQDLQIISDLVAQYIGVRSKLVRFPGGSSNIVSRKTCPGIMSEITRGVGERGYYYFDWNVTNRDAEGKSFTAAQKASFVVNAARNKNEICVLMHDMSNKPTTIDALPAMVAGLRQLGFQFRTLGVTSNGFHQSVLN